MCQSISETMTSNGIRLFSYPSTISFKWNSVQISSINMWNKLHSYQHHETYHFSHVVVTPVTRVKYPKGISGRNRYGTWDLQNSSYWRKCITTHAHRYWPLWIPWEPTCNLKYIYMYIWFKIFKKLILVFSTILPLVYNIFPHSAKNNLSPK